MWPHFFSVINTSFRIMEIHRISSDSESENILKYFSRPDHSVFYHYPTLNMAKGVLIYIFENQNKIGRCIYAMVMYFEHQVLMHTCPL